VKSRAEEGVGGRVRDGVVARLVVRDARDPAHGAQAEGLERQGAKAAGHASPVAKEGYAVAMAAGLSRLGGKAVGHAAAGAAEDGRQHHSSSAVDGVGGNDALRRGVAPANITASSVDWGGENPPPEPPE